MHSTRMCTRCVLTDAMPGIEFDEQGLCNYCRKHEAIRVKPESELLEILEKFRAPASKYECMVGLSGGRDSTYVLWKLAHDYKMKVLAVTYANPFVSPQARTNIEQAAKRLNVDCVTWGFAGDEHRQATQRYLRIWGRHPSSSLIPLVCAHCKTWWPGFFKTARDNGIRLVVIGSNPLETALFKKKGFGGARTYHRLSNLPHVIGRALRELAANPRYLTTSWAMVLRMYLGASHSTPYMRWRHRDVTVVRLFDYLPWNERTVETTIARELGWRKSPEVESSWRFDCRLDYVRRLMYASTVGCTELRDLLSKMVREHMLSREEALARLENEEAVPRTVVDDVLNGLGLSLSDLRVHIDQRLLK